MKNAQLGLASTIFAVAMLAGCANSQTREAAPPESSASVVEGSEAPSPTVPETSGKSAAPVETDSADLTTEPLENPEGQRAQGWYPKSTRVCFKNETGSSRSYVFWVIYDTKDDWRSWDKVCAEGTRYNGDDISGAIHLVKEGQSNETIVDFFALNTYLDSELRLSGPGIYEFPQKYQVGSWRKWNTDPNSNPIWTIKAKRLPDTKWVEFEIIAYPW